MSWIENVKKIIGNKEGINLAYKPIPPSSIDLAKLISSFANTDGGIIILGVEAKSNGTIAIKGLSVEFRVNSILNIALALFSSDPTIFTQTITYEGKSLFVIKIEKSEIPLLIKEKKYTRVGNKIRSETDEYRDTSARETKPWSKKVGRYLAIIIGVNDYDYHKELKHPEKDASKLKEILETHYSFNPVILLLTPTRNEIIDTFDRLDHDIKEGDNLLIYYAGHGHWEEDINTGFWFPKDAEKKQRKNWLENSTIHNYCKRYKKCQHILLVSDSCFSGTFIENMRSPSLDSASKAIEEYYKNKSRTVITSGWIEKVPDQSVFFKQLSKVLIENNELFMSALNLFNEIRDKVTINSHNNHKPQKDKILDADDNGGDFIFIKNKT